MLVVSHPAHESLGLRGATPWARQKIGADLAHGRQLEPSPFLPTFVDNRIEGRHEEDIRTGLGPPEAQDLASGIGVVDVTRQEPRYDHRRQLRRRRRTRDRIAKRRLAKSLLG